MISHIDVPASQAALNHQPSTRLVVLPTKTGILLVTCDTQLDIM
jgi:hypothetical protein